MTLWSSVNNTYNKARRAEIANKLVRGKKKKLFKTRIPNYVEWVSSPHLMVPWNPINGISDFFKAVVMNTVCFCMFFLLGSKDLYFTFSISCYSTEMQLFPLGNLLSHRNMFIMIKNGVFWLHFRWNYIRILRKLDSWLLWRDEYSVSNRIKPTPKGIQNIYISTHIYIMLT